MDTSTPRSCRHIACNASSTGVWDGEGLISNYQRVLDGFLAGLDHKTLAKAQNVSNSGFDAGILDIGF